MLQRGWIKLATTCLKEQGRNDEICNASRNKTEKFRINLKKAWWKLKGQTGQEQSRQIQNKSEKSMVKWPKIWWNSKIQRDFTIPFLFQHAFSKHFIMLFPNPAVFFWILPFQASFTMLLLHISPWFILRCHFSLNPLWKTPPMSLFGNHFWSASPPLSPIIQGLGYTREELNFLHNPVIYENTSLELLVINLWFLFKCGSRFRIFICSSELRSANQRSRSEQQAHTPLLISGLIAKRKLFFILSPEPPIISLKKPLLSNLQIIRT